MGDLNATTESAGLDDAGGKSLPGNGAPGSEGQPNPGGKSALPSVKEPEQENRTPQNVPVDAEIEAEGAELKLFSVRGRTGRATLQYNSYVGDVIATLLAQNMSRTLISTLPGMPSVASMLYWEKSHKEFREKMALARQARAEHLADTALQIAERSTWQTSKADKIKVDTALKLAAAYDPDTYGAKTKVTGDPNAPLTFLISTGITREGDTGTPIEVKLDTTDYAKDHEKDPPLEIVKEEAERD